MSQVTKTFTEHPQNSMILMNGAVLECFPKESNQGDFVPDQMAHPINQGENSLIL